MNTSRCNHRRTHIVQIKGIWASLCSVHLWSLIVGEIKVYDALTSKKNIQINLHRRVSLIPITASQLIWKIKLLIRSVLRLTVCDFPSVDILHLLFFFPLLCSVLVYTFNYNCCTAQHLSISPCNVSESVHAFIIKQHGMWTIHTHAIPPTFCVEADARAYTVHSHFTRWIH